MSAARFGPMTGGLDVEMESGEPRAVGAVSRRAVEEERRNRAMEKHLRLVEDLAGAGGEMARQIAAKLAARIDTLITADPEACAYLGLLKDVQGELRVGERLVAQEVQALLTQGDPQAL